MREPTDEIQRLQKELLQMQVRIAKREYDIEPWKWILTIFASGAAVAIAAVAVATFIMVQLIK